MGLIPESYINVLHDDPDAIADELKRVGIKTPAHMTMPHVRDHEHCTPVFAFDYISLLHSKFCFDNPAIDATDWVCLMKKCKQISLLTYDNILDRSYEDDHRFHTVPHKKLEPHGLLPYLQEICSHTAKTSRIALPELHQFALYTDNKIGKAPRVVGFIGKWGVFFLLWFDIEHLIYQHK